MQEPLVSRVLRYALWAVLAVGAAGAVTLPFMLDRYFEILYDAYQLEPGYRTFILAFLMGVAVPSLWSCYEMIGMLRTIPEGPFVRRNVRALGRVGAFFLALAAAFLAKCLVYVTFLTLLIGLLFIGGGLFAFTLASLFRRAVEFREENDLTI